MESNFTQNDLILYLYNETWLADTVMIQDQIDKDPAVELEFESLKATMGFLDGLQAEPSKKCLNKIFELI